jgi:uncharacterized protein YqjF (DUF2071 family)
MSDVFLTARWEYLILITYAVPQEKLTPSLPKGIVPDTLGGNCFASLVAFDFKDTKVKGMKIPFHINFPEINLRFYVRREDTGERGVVFVKELVPKFMIEFIANTVYNEPYESVKMESSMAINGKINLEHNIEYEGKPYSIKLEAENKPFTPSPDSKEHFFKEHSWGFGKTKKGETLVYRVEHPVWEIFPVTDIKYNFDFGAIYGKEWGFLNDSEPYNITFAKGSEIKVYGAKKM